MSNHPSPRTPLMTVAGAAALVALLAACQGPTDGSQSPPHPSSEAGTAAPAPGDATTAAGRHAAGGGKTLNGTTPDNGLTISDGTRRVVMNGTTVDFGTPVHDLAWSPDGTKAAFVDGDGNLAVSAPDGSSRVTVARNPGGETWSHPAWQVAPASEQDGVAAKNNIIFAAVSNGTKRLESVPATAVNGTPAALSMGTYSGLAGHQVPETGNAWPSGAGTSGSSYFANVEDGMVYARNDYGEASTGPTCRGSEPAMAHDQDRHGFVFVRSVDGHDHVFVSRALTYRCEETRDITPNATTDYTEPAWSPDDRTIAARTSRGIVTFPADGSGSPRLVSTYQGLPAYRG